MIEDNRYFWSHLKTGNVTVSVKPREKVSGAVFRVRNLIDIGNGRQTAILNYVDFPQIRRRKQPFQGELAIPFKMGHLDFVYTSRCNPAVQDVQGLIDLLHERNALQKIVPDVLSPGDYLVFRQSGDDMRIKMVDALRTVRGSVGAMAEYAV